jgi:hypothetical protein
MLPRRFYTLSVFSAFALLFVFFFLDRDNVTVSVPVSLPDSWTEAFEQTWKHTMEKAPPVREGEVSKEDGNAGKLGFVQHGDKGGTSTAAAVVTQASVSPTSIATNFPKPTPFPPEDPPLPDQLRVAIVESGGTNEETTAALIHAFGVQNHTQLSLYLLQQRYGIDEVINNFNLSHPIAVNKSSTDFAEAIGTGVAPHIIVSATCESDLVALDAPLTKLLSRKSTYLFCIIHQPERWSQKDLTAKIRPWIDHQMVDLVTLSQHTARYLRMEVINDWDFNATVTVRHLAPLFPVKLPDNDFPASQAASNSDSDSLQYPIAIHGDFDATRHNYTDVFNNVLALKARAENITVQTKTYTKTEKRSVSLHILGERIPPGIPHNVKPILSVDGEMSFQRQYEILSRSYILLPAFASGASSSDYLSKLASWSIPAALIAGVPFAGDEELLQAYSYAPRDAAWFRYAGENEMKVAERVVLWSEEEHLKKKQTVREKTKGLIERNAQLVGEWVGMAMMRVERAGWRMGVGSVQDFYQALAAEDE